LYSLIAVPRSRTWSISVSSEEPNGSSRFSGWPISSDLPLSKKASAAGVGVGDHAVVANGEDDMPAGFPECRSAVVAEYRRRVEIEDDFMFDFMAAAAIFSETLTRFSLVMRRPRVRDGRRGARSGGAPHWIFGGDQRIAERGAGAAAWST